VPQNRYAFKLATLRYVHEILFSLTVAFLVVSLIFLVVPRLSIPFVHFEIFLNRLLHIRQTDLIRGYFEYLISSAILALGIGTLLHMFSGTRLTSEILRSVAGVVLLLAPLVFWVCYYQILGWPFGWPYRWAPIELAGAFFCLALYLFGRLPAPRWTGLLLLAAHYSFWYLIPSSDPGRADYAGPIAPVLGFSSTLVWGMYVARLDRASTQA
jgi:hypothetical protein